MQTIGERLEEARKRKGISLREAAEGTKIRSDFLSSIEQNKFDFDLPEIYKRGFLKNYARYLKLDVEKILTDYNAQLLGNSRLGKKAGAEWFGQMEAKKPTQPDNTETAEENEGADEGNSKNSLGHIYTKPGTATEEYEIEETPEKDDADKTFYLKIGLIFVGTLALVFVVFGLIWAILGSGNDGDSDAGPATPELREATSASDILTGGGSGAASSNSVTLEATGNVYVLVRQKDDDVELYRKTMQAGESAVLEKSGPVDILFTAGENLIIQHSGERLKPSTSGTAKITIP